MPSSSPRRYRAKPASAGAAARDWAALPRDILSAVFLRLGPCLEIMRGAELACAAWRRAAVEDPGLWRRVDIDVGALASAGLRKGWGAMLRAAVDRGAGRCEAFSGPCDQELLLYLIERANSLKNLHLLCLDVPNEVLKVAVKKYPHLEDLELKYVSSPSDDMLISVCQACPRLKKLKLTFSPCFDEGYGDDEQLVLDIIEQGIPMMSELLSLQLFQCDLTTEGLASILDNCPLLESLHITGSFKYYEMDDELQAKCTRVKNLTIPKYSIHG
uniref:F-box domain-containing protein n=1 Tax=Setaria viridis TaxID=4556 RepID=A0A4U6U549_SETVI|nr:hypothetical protein SEVIR_6G030700v2 [Setaria viridis]